MDSMKDLVIQALESKGVLGQIRANLRSAVFKIVDDQDQQFNMGCGLKWENKKLYRILETKVGQLLSEIIREFMEYFRMDYSLSIFIPECGISPERLNKEEILGKLGVKADKFQIFKDFNLPFLYFIVYYFLESLKEKPDDIINKFNKVKNTIEDKSDNIINDNINSLEAIDIYSQGNNPQNEQNQNENQRLNEEQFQENQNQNSSQEMRRQRLDLDKKEREEIDSDKNKSDNSDKYFMNKIPSMKEELKNREDQTNQGVELVNEEIKEDIIQDEEYEKSNDKKNSSSNNAQTVSLSGGNDISVDSHKLETYNFVENAEKVNK